MLPTQGRQFGCGIKFVGYGIRPNNAVSHFTSNDLQQIEWASVPGCVTSGGIHAIARILRERLSPGELIVLTKLLA